MFHQFPEPLLKALGVVVGFKVARGLLELVELGWLVDHARLNPETEICDPNKTAISTATVDHPKYRCESDKPIGLLRF